MEISNAEGSPKVFKATQDRFSLPTKRSRKSENEFTIRESKAVFLEGADLNATQEVISEHVNILSS